MSTKGPEKGIFDALRVDASDPNSGLREDAKSPQMDMMSLEKMGEILDRKKSVIPIITRTISELNTADQRKEIAAELICDLFKSPHSDEASLIRLIKVLRSFGIRDTDPRLKPMFDKIRKKEDEDDESSRHYLMCREQFKEIIYPCTSLISRVLRQQLIIPSWLEFTQTITKIFEKIRLIEDGEVASYIPQLARENPHLWGMSICTIDGQRFSLGDSKKNFCLQSVSKAFNYAIVASEIGSELLHQYVGHEPSGRLFNEICLDSNNMPHNPLINAGAIVVTSMIKNQLSMSDRFDFMLKKYRQLAGGGHVGFDNATFLSERDTADRNYALSYYMKEYKCFPDDSQGLREELDLYFQLCSLETNCDTAAVMAATLANGGVCPLTNDKCIGSRPCRDVLSLMYSCGMYDFSGKFSFQVGLPAKSGVSGTMIVVVPNVMGIALYSPPLDKTGNSCRGVAFCKELIENFNFHNYDSLLHADDSKKCDPRRRVGHRETEAIVQVMFAAKYNDFDTLRKLFMQGADLTVKDYDGRTALHVAAAEGHANICRFLVNVVGIKHNVVDRWNRMPIEDARQFGHDEIVAYLLKVQHHKMRKQMATGELNADEADAEETGDGELEEVTDESGEEEASRGYIGLLNEDIEKRQWALHANGNNGSVNYMARRKEMNANGMIPFGKNIHTYDNPNLFIAKSPMSSKQQMNGHMNGHPNGQLHGHANGQINGHMNGNMNGHATSTPKPMPKHSTDIRKLSVPNETEEDPVLTENEVSVCNGNGKHFG
ncbi:unnamed protein product [Caenorhabditis bovis]|uniref:glutaminase n=1 Tax=Caenorhabditis bovis TaxID=2654633 RepID=A0A8S1EZ69_9PELO|nr:unnamed protein product [Caenorhabditis bovis]